MKHIIIAGGSRCGKTTLSLMFREKGFNHYKMDSIKRGIDNNFWNGYKDDWRKVSPHMAHLINQVINECESDLTNNKEWYVIDTCHLYPSDIAKYNLKNTTIVFLGYTDIDIEKKLKEIRKYDKNAWTNKASDDDIRFSLKLGIDYSRETKEECKNYNIKYFDTSKNFKKVINEAYKYIEGELDENTV